MKVNSHRGWTVLVGRIAAAIALSAAISTAHAEKREFELTIDEVSINVAPGFNANVFAFNGQVPGPLIHVREGDEVTVHVTNNTTLPHTIHWHGVNQTDNWKNDGVPDITQKAIQPGEAFTYHWKAERPGSVWYHCHVKGGAPADVADYFSVNGKSFPLTQPIRVHKGDVMRIRMTGAGDEVHEMHLHGHDQLVSYKDGYALPSPYLVDTVPVGPCERYDAIVKMNNPGRFIFHDHVDKHLNMGGMLGGPITVIEYDGIPSDSWYVWAGKVYDPDFFYSESMKKGYGMFGNPNFVGTPIATARRPRQP